MHIIRASERFLIRKWNFVDKLYIRKMLLFLFSRNCWRKSEIFYVLRCLLMLSTCHKFSPLAHVSWNSILLLRSEKQDDWPISLMFSFRELNLHISWVCWWKSFSHNHACNWLWNAFKRHEVSCVIRRNRQVALTEHRVKLCAWNVSSSRNFSSSAAYCFKQAFLLNEKRSLKIKSHW